MARRTPGFCPSFIQKFIREFRSLEVPPRKILVAVSGGVDSTALALAFWEVKALLHLELAVAHVHHGLSNDETQNAYRDQAQLQARALAEKLSLPFFTAPAPTAEEGKESALFSEASLRKYRYGLLEEWRRRHHFEAIALGHHFEDLLETQVMRLLRGTSLTGLEAMRILSPQGRLRPFLNFKKEELEKFVRERREAWLEDPSNKSMHPKRNHLRQWLKEAEKIHPGAQENLAKSLQRMAQWRREVRRPWKESVLTNGGIARSLFIRLSRPLKAELLAEYLRRQNVFDYTSGQIHELITRLDGAQKETSFTYLGCHWTLGPEMIKRSPGIGPVI
jgi:tRNA(Ile)-lysidine synthase